MKDRLITCRLESSLLNRLLRIVRRKNKTISEIIRELLIDFLKEEENPINVTIETLKKV